MLHCFNFPQYRIVHKIQSTYLKNDMFNLPHTVQQQKLKNI